MVNARFSPDGKRIASGTSSGIGIWNLEGVQLDVLRGHEGQIRWLDWSPDGMELASAGAGGSARVWNLDVPRGIPAHVGHGRSDVAVSPSGAAVVFTSETEGALILCDARGKRLKKRPVDLTPRKHHVGFLRDGETVAVYNEKSTNISLWNVLQSPEGERPSQELKLPFRLRGNPPELLPDGRWLLQRENYKITTWDGSASIRIDSPEDAVESFTVSADGMRVLCGGWTGVVIRSTVDGAELWRPNESWTAWFVSFSQDGRHVLAAGNNNEAYLWTPPEREGTVLRGHQDRLSCAVFSRDGTRIATAAMNGSIRVWDRESLQTILRLSGKGVNRIAFTKTGQLVSAGTDGTVRWWWLEVEPLRQAVEQLDVGELTQAERERVAHLFDD
jgi:WD40 repeat protein